MLLLYTKYIHTIYHTNTIPYTIPYTRETYKRRLHGQMMNEINVHYISILRLYNRLNTIQKRKENDEIKKEKQIKTKGKILKHSHIYSYIV